MASRWTRRVLVGTGAVVAGWAALHAVNHVRLDAGALRAIYGPRPLCKKNLDTIARRFAAIYPASRVEPLLRAMMGIRARPV
jgi:hypothetical protein